MNINWSTVFFQIINFWIIVWILKKYLFKPVLSSMDKRERAIQSRLKEAENAKNKAEKEKQNLLNKIASLEQSKASILAEAYKKADAEYAIMLKSFNAEMAGKRKAFEEQVVLEREFLRNSIKDLAGETILKTLADALQNLANTNVEKAILESPEQVTIFPTISITWPTSSDKTEAFVFFEIFSTLFMVSFTVSFNIYFPPYFLSSTVFAVFVSSANPSSRFFLNSEI